MADANHNETKVLEGFLNDILKDAEYEGMPALDWLEQGLCVDEFTLQLDKPELLKLLSKALVALAVQQNNYSKTIENYELVNEKNVAIHKMVNIATNAALAKYDAVEKMVKTNQAKNNANLRYTDDIKQNEKKIVKKCWDAWQIKPSQYKNNTNFASAMIDKFRPDDPNEENRHLSSVKVITDWCRDWKCKNRTLLADLAPS